MRTPKVYLAFLLLLAAPGLLACAQESPTVSEPQVGTTPSPAGTATAPPSPAPRTVTVQMRPLNDSGQSGTAALTEEDGRTRVVVDLANSPAGPQPAHIHPGTCDTLDPRPRYGLTNVANGKSVTPVDVPLADLLAGGFSINVHKSAQEAAVYVSCGEIKG